MTTGTVNRAERDISSRSAGCLPADGRQPALPDISVVIPVYNEAQNVELLYQSLSSTLGRLEESWEIVFVDDGSVDDTLEALKALQARDRRVRVVRLRRNFGQTAAVSAGFDYALGSVIITMDGDLQNDAADIPRLLEKLREGHDIVSGWRRDRKDPFVSKAVPSIISNKLASWLTGIDLHDYGCTLKAYRREVVQSIRLYGELHRYIPAVASSIGVDVAEIVVSHHPRRHGKSKYGLLRLVRGLIDLVSLKLTLSYITRPMQMFGLIGLLLFLLGTCSGTATIAMKLLGLMDVTGNPLLYLTILAYVLSVQFFSLGFLGDIMMRTYHESQRKPIYSVQQVFEDSHAASAG